MKCVLRLSPIFYTHFFIYHYTECLNEWYRGCLYVSRKSPVTPHTKIPGRPRDIKLAIRTPNHTPRFRWQASL